MIARWQRGALLLGFALWALASGLAWAQGHPALALAFTGLALGGHAAWLGLTVLLMRRVQRASGVAPPAGADAWRSWWAECRAAPRVFAWRQPFRTHAEPDVWPADAAGRQGVLLVHGYLCNRAIWNPWLRRLRARGIPAVAVTLEPPGAALDTHVPTLAAAAQQLWQRTGRAPLLVGHSMGGLALRAWRRADAGRTPVAGLVTVGTPHQGTWMALWGHSASARQMQPGSAWLRQLAADEARLRAEGSEAPAVLSVFSPCDSIVFPTQGAVWPGGEALAVAGAGHVDLLQHATVFEAVCQRLEGARAEAGGYRH